MKTIIIYATKSGASKKCAELLTTKLKDCSLCRLPEQVPDLYRYDTVILGSGVRMGKIYKPMKNFIEKNVDILLTKKTALYLCSVYPESLQKTITKNIPQKLIESTVCIESLGGIPPFTSPKNENWMLVEHVNKLVHAVTSRG